VYTHTHKHFIRICMYMFIIFICDMFVCVRAFTRTHTRTHARTHTHTHTHTQKAVEVEEAAGRAGLEALR
jgi:hypothetical protein